MPGFVDDVSLAAFRHLILTLFGIVVSLEYWNS